MTQSATRYEVNEAEIAAKVMDGEAVLINLSTGAYYSTNETAGVLWPLIECRCDTEQMVAALTNRYDVAPSEARVDVDNLLKQLTEEGIIRATEGSQTNPPAGDPSSTELPYEAPRLEVFRDMAQLLALDPPMPDVGELAWRRVEEDSGE